MKELPLNQVLCGDCVDVLKTFPENSIDLVVTDPPYGLKFMGKDWDKTLPPRDAFCEMHRVLKPGALAFVMSSPRQDLMARMIMLLEYVGFKTDISFIDWIYKTGFPKAYDVSKGIDRKLGYEPQKVGQNPNLKGRKEFGNANERVWNIDRSNSEAGLYAGVRDYSITAPASDLAKEWEGWKSVSGLKPAHEPVLMVYKPRSEKTIVDNVLRWGSGAMNVDACRIPFKNDADFDEAFRESRGKFSSFSPIEGLDKKRDTSKHRAGRFPANLICGLGIDLDIYELLSLQEELKK